MTIDIRHNPDKAFLIITVTGQLSDEEYQAAMDEIIKSDQYPASINALWDVREQDFRGVNSSSVKNIIEISKQYPERGGSRVAFVVKDNLAYGMLRMYELSTSVEEFESTQNHRVFRDYSEGEEWLLAEES